MISETGLDSQTVLDALSQGILIFDNANRLVQENAAAHAILGADLKLIRSEGWAAAAMLFNTRLTDPTKMVETARTVADESGKPVRFHMYRSGERVPCWISTLRRDESAETYTMITIETPDWTAIADLSEKYLDEVREVVTATHGHAQLIDQSLIRAKPTDTAEQLGKRIGGFTRVIDMHMIRLLALTDLVERLERVRTGAVRELIHQKTRRVVLYDFMEDFLEGLSETDLVDPESSAGDLRQRIFTVIPQKVAIATAPDALAQVLRDILRNAIMYSMRGTPIKIVAYGNRESSVQIDVIDEGCGIRATESERVFLPFTRSRQPQVMGEFGYGLSLYLCRNEVEVMNGRIWFESEEGVGTTFSLKLPAWRDTSRLFASSSEG